MTWSFPIVPYLIMNVRTGSHAYGLNTEDSDVDMKGVLIEPRNHHFGFLHKYKPYTEQTAQGAPADWAVYSLKEFARMATACNPNILEMLYCDVNDILIDSVWAQALRGIRDQFLSRAVYKSFGGYAHDQLKLLQKTHERWKQGLPPEHIKENTKRAELQAKFGFDTKNAMHLIRLQRMGLEILLTGKVNVRRTDRDHLLAIRAGEVEYEAVLAESTDLELRAEYHFLRGDGPLPAEPDRELLDRFVCQETETFLSWRERTPI